MIHAPGGLNGRGRVAVAEQALSERPTGAKISCAAGSARRPRGFCIRHHQEIVSLLQQEKQRDEDAAEDEQRAEEDERFLEEQRRGEGDDQREHAEAEHE